jgi:hypothetical protein
VGIECPPPLARVLKGCLGIERAIPAGEPLPTYDFHVALCSLPATMGTTLQTVPAAKPYLGVNSAAVELWRERLKAVSGMRIGIAWDTETESGKPDRRNSIPLGLAQRLAKVPDITLVNLQSAAGHPQPPGMGSLADIGSLPDAPAERCESIAAAVRELDLVIASDNLVAHLGGAMGAQTWVCLAMAPEPRWMLGREDSPWYPTMRLFRQRVRGDWNEVVTRVLLAIESRVKAR